MPRDLADIELVFLAYNLSRLMNIIGNELNNLVKALIIFLFLS